MKAVQHFSDDYLARCANMTPEQVVRYLDDFRQLQTAIAPQPSTLISLRVPAPLLGAFRTKATAEGVAYQTQIKRLMENWIRSN